MSCKGCQAVAHEHAADRTQNRARSPEARVGPPRYGLDFVDRNNGGGRIQLKPRIGAANDPLEREADRLADAVMNGGFAGPVSHATAGTTQRSCQSCAAEERPIQRKCAACAEEETVRREAAPGAVGGGSADVAARAVAGGGAPLPTSARSFFGARFGRDFADVRIHADSGAGAAALGIGARAYTLGQKIAFAPGEYAPDQPGGRRLLAHELAHVVQQGGGGNTIRRAELGIIPAGSANVPTATQRRAAASCDISCGGTAAPGANAAAIAAAAPVSVGTFHAMPLSFHSSRGAVLAGAAGANGVGAALHFVRNATNPVAGNPCAACTAWKIIQVLHTNQTPDSRARQDYVDNLSSATPFYDDIGLSGAGLHPIPAGYVDAGDQNRTTRSIYDRPFRDATHLANIAGTSFFWEAEACVTCVKPGRDKVLGCVTYGFNRPWVPTPPAPGAPAPAHGAPPAGAYGPLQAISPACRASPSARFSTTLRGDPSTNTYDFET